MVLVTGAAGHLGNNLIRKLVETGEKVRAFLMPGEPDVSLKGLPVEIVRGDIRNPADVEKAVRDTDTVYHLAGVISLSPRKKDLLYQVNLGGTKNVIAACKTEHVKKLVHTASVHAFADAPQGVVIDEKAALSPEKAVGHYGKSKAMAAQEIFRAVHDGLDAVIVCPSGIIGPNDYAPSRMGKLLSGLRGKRWFVAPEKAIYDFVDVRDVAEGEILAARKGKPGEVFLLSGHKIDLGELIKTTAEIEGRKLRLSRAPEWLLKIGAFFSTLFAPANKEPLITPETLEIVQSNCDYDNSVTRKELGIAPRPIGDTIRDTINWLDNHGKS